MARSCFLLLAVLCLSAPVDAQRGRGTATVAPQPVVKEPTLRVISENETLKDIVVMTVTVDGLDLPWLKYQLTADTLKAAVELRLRQTGILVKSRAESGNSIYPNFYIRFIMLDNEKGLIAYSVRAEFSRLLEVPGPPDYTLFANSITWADGGIGTTGTAKAAGGIKEDVDNLVTKFLNAYLEQNPKR